MIEEDYQIIPPNHIVGRVLVWLKDVSQPEFYDFQILKFSTETLLPTVSKSGQ